LDRKTRIAHGLEKWIIAAWATWRVTSAQQPFELILDVDGRDTVRQTPLLFIGNDAYRMEGFDAASRESLDDDQLATYVVKAGGQWRLIRLVWRILTGTARKSGELAIISCSAKASPRPITRGVCINDPPD